MAIGKPLWSLANLNFQLKQLKSSTPVLRAVGYLTLHNGIWKNVISILSRNPPFKKSEVPKSTTSISPGPSGKIMVCTPWIYMKNPRCLTMGFSCIGKPYRFVPMGIRNLRLGFPNAGGTGTPRKINILNLKTHPFCKGKSSEPNHHDFRFQPLIFQVVYLPKHDMVGF